jgi:hypothetical protein
LENQNVLWFRGLSNIDNGYSEKAVAIFEQHSNYPFTIIFATPAALAKSSSVTSR